MMSGSHADRLDEGIGKWTGRIGLVIFGWLACSAYYGTLHLRHVESVELPKAVQAAKCEGRRGDIASVVAGKAIVGAVVDGAPIPSTKEIPKDNCPPPVSAQ